MTIFLSSFNIMLFLQKVKTLTTTIMPRLGKLCSKDKIDQNRLIANFFRRSKKGFLKGFPKKGVGAIGMENEGKRGNGGFKEI